MDKVKEIKNDNTLWAKPAKLVNLHESTSSKI